MANPNLQKVRTVRPDSKGRISLGKRAREFSGYTMKESKDGRIVLEPLVEVPAQEGWLFKNKEAMESVSRGIKESAAGNTKLLGSFSRYLKNKEE